VTDLDHLETAAADTEPTDGEQWVTRRDAAAIVGCSVSAIRKWERAGVVRSGTAEDGRTVTVWLADVRERYAGSAPTAVRHSADATVALDQLAARFAAAIDTARQAGELAAAERELERLRGDHRDLRHELEEQRARTEEQRQRADLAEVELARTRVVLSARQRRRLDDEARSHGA
jgi:hypothetical protein